MSFLDIAMRQSALDLGCDPSDFMKPHNTVIISSPRPGAKVYLQKPQDFFLIRYGSRSVVAVNERIYDQVVKYFAENDNLDIADLADFGLRATYLLQHYLPAEEQTALPCRYATRLLYHDDLSELYLPPWTDNALCDKRRERDMLAIGAYDGEKLIGLAGASCDCAEMWQIGIDVLPEYRLQGVASALTSRLSIAIKKLGKLPFYSHSFGNMPSMKNAFKSGFRPAWIQIQANFV